MPTYDNECGGCKGFDALGSVRQRDLPAACPGCGGASPRLLAGAPRRSLMFDGRRRAIAVNERSSHQPKRSCDCARSRHPSGCGCCRKARRGVTVTVTVTALSGANAFPSKRSWMTSH